MEIASQAMSYRVLLDNTQSFIAAGVVMAAFYFEEMWQAERYYLSILNNNWLFSIEEIEALFTA